MALISASASSLCLSFCDTQTENRETTKPVCFLCNLNSRFLHQRHITTITHIIRPHKHFMKTTKGKQASAVGAAAPLTLIFSCRTDILPSCAFLFNGDWAYWLWTAGHFCLWIVVASQVSCGEFLDVCSRG